MFQVGEVLDTYIYYYSYYIYIYFFLILLLLIIIIIYLLLYIIIIYYCYYYSYNIFYPDTARAWLLPILKAPKDSLRPFIEVVPASKVWAVVSFLQPWGVYTPYMRFYNKIAIQHWLYNRYLILPLVKKKDSLLLKKDNFIVDSSIEQVFANGEFTREYIMAIQDWHHQGDINGM